MYRWWVLSVLGVIVGCATSGSGDEDEDDDLCSSDDECGPYEICGTTDCTGFPRCIPTNCACSQGPGYIIAPGDACLSGDGDPPPRCTCDEATCDDPLDSCGLDTCPGVCQPGESCAVCLEGDACGNAEVCLGSYCISHLPGRAFCLGLECLRAAPPLCGTPDAPCGEDCCQPDCSGRECGDDPNCNVSCGECGAHTFCSIDTCRSLTGLDLCPGDLRALDPIIPFESVGGTMPQPTGGVIVDGTYDLIAQHRYQLTYFADVYLRSALRFSANATQVEHIYDPDIAYRADGESPHRQLTVVADGTTLNFEVTCPVEHAIFDFYTRGFTVQGSELRLFQESSVEIYARRP